MNNFTKKFITETLKKIPFFKKILITGNFLNWINIKYENLFFFGLKKGLLFISATDFYPLSTKSFDLNNDNYKILTHKDINLYQVSIYNICVELKIFITEIDLNNNAHKDAVESWYERSAQYIDHILLITRNITIKKNIIVQGHVYQSAIIRAISILKNIPLLSLENTANKDKLLWENISGITVNKNLSMNYYWKNNDSVDSKTAKKYVSDMLNCINNTKRLEHGTPNKIFSKTSSNPLIVIIGQVYTDASTLFGINKGFNTPLDVIRLTVEYALKNNMGVIVKLHPKENMPHNPPKKINNYHLATWTKICEDSYLKEMLTTTPGITVDFQNEFDTYSIIEKGDAIVTINSQAGLEALIKEKNVILCGKSFYDSLGVTFNAENETMLTSFLDLILKEKVSLLDINATNKFFYIFFEKYCVNKNKMELLKLITKKP